MCRTFLWLPVFFLPLLFSGCSAPLEKIQEIPGLDWPESVEIDRQTGTIYVSSIVGKGWEDDGKGYIAILTPEKKPGFTRWLESTEKHPLNAPKGICFLDGWIWFSDNGRLLKCNLKGGSPVEIKLPSAKKLNDVATDGKSVFVSDTALGLVYRVDPDGKVAKVKAPAGVNGITFHNGILYCVTVEGGEIYRLDSKGKKAPASLNLGENYTGLDGIVSLDENRLIVSDLRGGAIYLVDTEKNTTRKLIDVSWPADIEVDRKKKLLYVPALKDNKVIIYRINLP